MVFELSLIGFCLLLFGVMWGALLMGSRWGARWRVRREGESEAGLRAIEAAVFALMGLLIAFTFQGAASRFDDRRSLIVEEANAIGTTWLRIDLLPAEFQSELRSLFREYTDARIVASVAHGAAERTATAKTVDELQARIWAVTIKATAVSSTATTSLFVGSVNETFDLVTTRTMAQRMHPPMLVFVLLLVMMLLAGLLAGWALPNLGSNQLHLVTFAAVMALTFYVIVDLEYPRVGLLRVDDFDSALRAVRAGMK
jgi:hypothetical protein